MVDVALLGDPIHLMIAWLQSKEPAWFRQNSWINECATGFVAAGLLAWKLDSMFVAVIVFNGVSYCYERWLDPSANVPGHNPIDDIGQRAAGSLLAAWLVSLV